MSWHPAVRLCLAAILGLQGLAAARAQEFPSRPITIMVGLAAGGITDVTARLYAEVVSASIGQRILIENRQGAGGAVAAAAVQNAAPDGYTLLVFSGSQHAAVPAVQSAPYDPIKGFQPVTLLFNLAALVAVPVTSTANTVAELLEYGRQKPGGLLFGSPGVGTPSHLLAAKISDATKTPMQYVHYRGGAPMMADLVTGRVDFALASYTVSKGFFMEKKLKALAVDADARLSAMPDVPTLTEAGLGQTKVASWFALAAPAGTPSNVVQKLRDEFIKASRDPQLQRRLTENGTLINTSTPEQMAKLLAEEVDSTNQLVKSLGLRQQ
jgi:tripartite-type tricarboxylate transporter receptor subunit TctC